MTRFQNLKKKDIDEILRFMIACDIAEFGEADSSLEDLEEQWDEMDLEKDAWVARDIDGNVTGYACVSGENDRYGMDIYVHAQLCPEGLENELMGKCLERAAEIVLKSPGFTKAQLTGYATIANHRLQYVYESNGFDRHTYHYRMQLDFNGELDPPEWPEGFSLSPYQDKDELELFNLILSTFTWEGRDPLSMDAWRNLIFRGGRYDPEYFVLVRFGGKLVGAALCYAEESGGWIRQLAVAKEFQGKGLGSRLLRHMFSVFQKKGLPGAGLAVASLNTNARQFYERVGMYRKREFIEYRKLLG